MILAFWASNSRVIKSFESSQADEIENSDEAPLYLADDDESTFDGMERKRPSSDGNSDLWSVNRPSSDFFVGESTTEFQTKLQTTKREVETTQPTQPTKTTRTTPRIPKGLKRKIVEKIIKKLIHRIQKLESNTESLGEMLWTISQRLDRLMKRKNKNDTSSSADNSILLKISKKMNQMAWIPVADEVGNSTRNRSIIKTPPRLTGKQSAVALHNQVDNLSPS
ncbi:uncharacterized protein [Clytia hemisphaerica]|uniref:uncharacterized protein n=1 Tax=Clytia hemisphaerica TaxID=252671 RepID=UPI0034D5269B